MTLADSLEFQLWPGEPKYPFTQPQSEKVEDRPPRREWPGPNRAVTYVSSPTLTVHRPVEPCGVSVVVCPGGGYSYLEIDKEGHVVAQDLAERGITALVLKYRTRPDVSPGRRGPMDAAIRRAIMADGRQALRLARERSQEWGLDPNRVGVMGFSAGAGMAAALATQWDDPDAGVAPLSGPSAHPDFCAPIYPGISEAVLEGVGPDVPPVFLAVADDDRQTPVENCLRFYAALRASGVSTELHVFARARHGFGLGAPGTAAAAWPSLFMAWLADQGLL